MIGKKTAILLASVLTAVFLLAGCAEKTTKVTETPGDKAAAASKEAAPGEAQKPKVTEEAVKSVGDGARDAKPGEAKGAETAARPSAQKEEVVTAAKAVDASKSTLLETIHFEYDKSNITPEAKTLLDKNYDYLSKNGSVKILVVGHCDERGTNEYNMALGDRRAGAAKGYLANRGIQGARIETLSKGEEEPADQGHDEAAWAKNRRAQFIVK